MKKTKKQGALCSVLLTKYHSGDQVKKIEMDIFICILLNDLDTNTKNYYKTRYKSNHYKT
jgi:hypothetical protein